MDTVFWNQPYMTAIIGGLSGSLITIIAMCFLDYRSEKRWLKAGYLKEQTEFNIKFAFDFANAMYAFSELCDLFFFRSSDKKALIEEKEYIEKAINQAAYRFIALDEMIAERGFLYFILVNNVKADKYIISTLAQFFREIEKKKIFIVKTDDYGVETNIEIDTRCLAAHIATLMTFYANKNPKKMAKLSGKKYCAETFDEKECVRVIYKDQKKRDEFFTVLQSELNLIYTEIGKHMEFDVSKCKIQSIK